MEAVLDSMQSEIETNRKPREKLATLHENPKRRKRINCVPSVVIVIIVVVVVVVVVIIVIIVIVIIVVVVVIIIAWPSKVFCTGPGVVATSSLFMLRSEDTVFTRCV